MTATIYRVLRVPKYWDMPDIVVTRQVAPGDGRFLGAAKAKAAMEFYFFTHVLRVADRGQQIGGTQGAADACTRTRIKTAGSRHTIKQPCPVRTIRSRI